MKIVPTNRLIRSLAILLLPIAFGVLFVPGSQELLVAAALVLLLIGLTDIFFSWSKLDQVMIIMPDVVRLSKVRKAEFTLVVKNNDPAGINLRIGLPFPDQIDTPDRYHLISIGEGKGSASIIWQIKGLKLGEYILNTCYLETSSFTGFWSIRSKIQIHSRFRVYPNLISEQKNLAGLFLNRNMGAHAMRQVGKGRDFEQLREYIPGDCFEDIHWKATAKKRHPVTKIYQIERTQRIYVIVDASRLSARHIEAVSKTGKQNNSAEPDKSTILERFITAALIMGLAARKQGDHFGLLTFQDRIINFIRAGSGQAHYNAVRDSIFTLRPKIVTPDFSELFTFIGTRIRQRALLVFLTSLDDPVLSESFLKHIDIASRRHLILVNMINPGKAVPLFSSPNAKSADDLYTNLGGHMLWSNLNETDKLLKRQNIGFSLLDNEKMAAQLVSKYIAIKQRQIL